MVFKHRFDTQKDYNPNLIALVNTVKSVNKGHPRERQNMVFIDKWSLFRGNFVLFYQGRIIEKWPLFTVWSLFGVGL